MADERTTRSTGTRAPFQSRAALFAWLSHQGIAHLARLNLDAIASRVGPELLPQLRALGTRRRLIDVASIDTLATTGHWLRPSPLRDTLLSVVGDFLEDQRRDVERARATVSARLAPPVEPRAQPAHARLCQLRARIPDSVAPRLVVATDSLQVDARLPGFRFTDTEAVESLSPMARGFVEPEAKLTLSAEPQMSCTCGANYCVHALAAIDAALEWLRQPPSDRFHRALEELDRPAWERTLRALDAAMSESPAARAGIELTWRLDVVDETGVIVAPYLHKLGKNGQRGAGKRLGRRHLLLEYGAKLPADDARIAALLPERDGLASRALLEALVGHPRVVLADAPDVAVRVDRSLVGIVAEERGGAVRLSAGIEGSALHAGLLERVRRSRPEDALFVWDSRRLTLLDVHSEMVAVLAVLLRDGNVFPPESHGALLDALSKWALRVPVAMPRSVMGESVPALVSPVLRLTAESGGEVLLELRVRPLSDGPSFTPGEGPRDVHVRRKDKPFHAVRDLAQEKAAARTLEAALPLRDVEALERPFQFLLPTVEVALDLLAACAALEVPPDLEWVGTPLRVIGSGGVQALKVAVQRKREWFGVLGGLSVGGERVELARLLDAARRKERYVQIESHTYIELSEVLRRHLEQLADHAHASRHGLEIGPSALADLHALELAGATLDADTAWRELQQRVTSAAELDLPLPQGLEAQLRPYQVDGFRWLTRLAAWGAGGVLADDMGLGKTVQALALLLDRHAHGPALVVAPTSVAFNWRDEARRFAPSLRLIIYADAADRKALLTDLGPGDVLVVSYGLLVRDAAELAALRFSTLVLDEAQNLKNASTRRFRAARALQADFKCALSGTPIENHLGELWSLLTIVFPGLLGSWDAFLTRYAGPIEKRTDPRAAPALARVLQPFLLRRTKLQVETELPARTEVRVPIVLSTAEWTLYEDSRLATLSDLETRKSVLKDQQRRVQVLAALTRLRLLASHPRLYDASSELVSSKLARLMELVEELRAEGQRALVFSQFTSHLALVREALEARAIDYVYLDGRTPQKVRGQRVREFQEGNAPLFLVSLKAGGVGLNLTAATNVIHLDPWWNPAVEDQASDRAHRLGQTRPVTIYRLIALGTIEEQILSLHEQKRALIAEILDGKEKAGKISTQELLALLAERPLRKMDL